MATTAGAGAHLDVLGRAVADELATRQGWTGPPPSLAAAARALVAVLVADLRADPRPAVDLVRLPDEAHRLAVDAVDAGLSRGVAQDLTRALHRALCAPAFAGRLGPGEDDAAWFVDHLGAVEDALEGLIDSAHEARGADAARRVTLVRELLDERVRISASAASQRLGYDLRRAHVGVLGWARDGGATAGDVEAAVHDVARAIGPAQLTVPLSAGLVAGWAVPGRGDLHARVEARRPALEDRGVLVAISGPEHGLLGFRRVHQDVCHVERALTSLAAVPRGKHGVACFGDARLEALLRAAAG